MKYLKMLGLAAVAAMALMAVVGAGTASAENTTLCKETVTVCPVAQQWPSGTKIHAVLVPGTKAVLSGNLSVSCEESTVEGEITGAATANPLHGSITKLTFTKNCTNCPEVVSTNLPYTSTLTRTAPTTGTFSVHNARVELRKCFGFATCVATVATANLHAQEGPAPNQSTIRIKATNVPVSISGFGCGTSGTWNAEYEVTSPDPAYIST